MRPSGSRRLMRRSPCCAKTSRPCRVQREAVGARLRSGEGRGAGIAARVEDDALALALLPFVDPVLDHVREQQVAAVSNPDRTLGPAVVVHDLLEPRLRRYQPVEPRVEPGDDRLACGAGLELGDGGDGENADSPPVRSSRAQRETWPRNGSRHASARSLGSLAALRAPRDDGEEQRLPAHLAAACCAAPGRTPATSSRIR